MRDLIQNRIEKFWKYFCTLLVRKDLSLERLGSEYGGWTFYPGKINPDTIVYSFGIGEDITFDLSLISKFGCEIYAYDPTPKSNEWVKNQDLPNQFKWFSLGVSNYDGFVQFFPPENPDHISHTILENQHRKSNPISVPVNRISTILKNNKHDKIGLLKMDIEGAEFEVIDDLLSQHIEIEQILVEFHHFFPNMNIFTTIEKVLKLLFYGYTLIYISPTGHEYSFIKNLEKSII